jgi:hypothetical protein
VGVGADAARGGGKADIATAPPPTTNFCVTHTETGKIGAVSKTAWRFGPEDLVETKFIIIYCKKGMNRVCFLTMYFGLPRYIPPVS